MAYQTVSIDVPAFVWTLVSTDSETVVVQNNTAPVLEVFVGPSAPNVASKGLMVTQRAGADTITFSGLITGEDVYVRATASGSVIVLKNVP